MGIFLHALKSLNEYEPAQEITSNMGWIWVGRPNYAYSPEAQKYWIGIVKGPDQHVVEYDIKTDTFNEFLIGGIQQEKDDHNQPSLLIRASDKRLVAVYNSHVDNSVRVRISANPLDASFWHPEQTYNLSPGFGYSYSSIYQASNGNIFWIYRNRIAIGNEKWAAIISTDGGETFSNPIVLVDNGENRPYCITCQDGDNIHFTVTSGSPQSDPDMEIHIFHFYFNMVTETCHASDGSPLVAPVHDLNMTPVQYIHEPDRSWIVDIITKEGKPRILYTRYVDYAFDNFWDKDLYFIEWNGTSWTNNKKLGDVLDGQIEDGQIIQSASYMPASRFDVLNPDLIWVSKQVNGILEIHRLELRTGYMEQLTFNSPVDQWRPISVPSPVNNVLWLHKTRYNHWLVDYDNKLKVNTF